jgi:pyruvate/2-oxoglutarate/acetoin dehydrogenase E1 component
VSYFTEVVKGFQLLADRPNCVFLGQSVKYRGHALSRVLEAVKGGERLECPVFEDTQMGMSLGLALAGKLPVTIYPRFNFLLLATNQLVNHLDKLPIQSRGEWDPKVVVVVQVGSEWPLDPGPQHRGNFAEAYRRLLQRVHVVELRYEHAVEPGFRAALNNPGAYLIILHGEELDKG